MSTRSRFLTSSRNPGKSKRLLPSAGVKLPSTLTTSTPASAPIPEEATSLSALIDVSDMDSGAGVNAEPLDTPTGSAFASGAPDPAPEPAFPRETYDPSLAPEAPPAHPDQKVHGTAFLLSTLLGSLGLDQFYLGNIGLGILKFITFESFRELLSRLSNSRSSSLHIDSRKY